MDICCAWAGIEPLSLEWVRLTQLVGRLGLGDQSRANLLADWGCSQAQFLREYKLVVVG